MYDSLKAFVVKLKLFESHILKDELMHFPTCAKIKNQTEGLHFDKYASKIVELRKEFESRFVDVKDLEHIFSFIVGPFSVEVEKLPHDIQLEVIDFQNDSELKEKYREVGSPAIYRHLNDKFPIMKNRIAEILSYFGSTYLCETLFSHMKANKTAHRTRLTDRNLSNVLKIVCSQTIQPNIEEITNNKRCQVSSEKYKN
uniref:GYG3 n=1 Tax=Anopheles gambiae TaxID=7165 RepID=M9T3S3_ANOGA|nr:gYG3 [Anopheles gambiae]